MDMSEFDVILGMDWLTAHRVVIDYFRNRVTVYTPGGSRFIFQGDKHDALPHTMYDSANPHGICSTLKVSVGMNIKLKLCNNVIQNVFTLPLSFMAKNL